MEITLFSAKSYDRAFFEAVNADFDHEIRYLEPRLTAQTSSLAEGSEGALIDTRAVIGGLKAEKIGHLGLDVYKEEENLFFEDLSQRIIQDDVFARLQTFPNVLITGHQGFFTREALTSIAETTLRNATAFESGEDTLHEVALEGEDR